MTKLREQKWHDLPRQSRLARLMYPQLMETQFHGEVAAMSRTEGKRSPVEPQGQAPVRSPVRTVHVIPGFHRETDRRRKW